MYTSFHVKNFRCFDDLALDDLARVNLIAGKNNVGKTALLEGMFLNAGSYNPELVLRLNIFRGISKMQFELGQWAGAPWDPVFNRFNSSTEVIIEGRDQHSNTHTLRLKVVRDPEELKKVRTSVQQDTNGSGSGSSSAELMKVLRLEFIDNHQNRVFHLVMGSEGITTEAIPPSQFQSVFLAARTRPPLAEEADRFTNLVLEGKKNTLLAALKILHPDLNNLELLKFGGETIVHGEVDVGRPVPLMYMGDGMMRLLSVIGAISAAKGGIVLIDEIENGIHHSVLKEVWEAIGKAAREFNTQIFATTHSWECIVAAHQAFSENGMYDFKLHRLEQKKEGGIRVVAYDQETLGASIELGFEVR